MSSPAAGALEKRVIIEQRVTGSPQKTSRGAPDESWGTVVECWASIEPLKGREFVEAQQVNAAVTVRIRMHWRAGITAGMRVRRGTTIYDIQYPVNPRERNETLELMCSEGASNG